MIAYKFLADGAVAPFTGFRWPVGEWVDAGTVEPCSNGVHACTVAQLPYWLGRELWEIELDGEIVRQTRKLVASRGRLVRRHDGWNDDARAAFATELLQRARLRFGSVPVLSGYVVDIQRFRATGRTGLAAFAAARAAELSAGPRAYDRERARQADWLAERLGLGAP
ncbi:MAG TPA: hypothetical protein VE736_00550 [Gaiellaceae bacterium]|jgi:hypothetical protein|nr:hypothetical protein [Gaiellaceae bacterium]